MEHITPVDADTAVRATLSLEMVPGRPEAGTVPIEATCFGEWAAVPNWRRPGPDGQWTIYNLAVQATAAWNVPQAVAIEAARILAAAVPRYNLLPDKAEQRKWAKEVLWPIMRAAHEQARRTVLPRVEARPFLVEMRKVAYVVIFARDETDAARAADEVDAGLHVERASVDVSVNEMHCAASVEEVVSWDKDGAYMNDEALRWAYDGRLYSPEECPANLELVVQPVDHAYKCPARPRGSALGQTEPGPCNCDVRVFPAAATASAP